METKMYSITTPPTLNKFDFPLAKNEKLSLLEMVKAVYYRLVIAKSMTEPGNSNNLYLANKSTPNYRAVFVCSERTPKENNQLIFQQIAFLSMVAFDGKGFALCCVPSIAVFQPVKRYRPTLESLAIAPKNLYLELSAMIYLFLCSDRYAEQYSETVVRVQADTEQQAQYNLTAQYRPLMLVTKAPDDKSDYINAKLAKFKANRMGVQYA